MIRYIVLFLAAMTFIPFAHACEWGDGKQVTRDEKTQFSGEVKAGNPYEHEFFPGLFFRLVPEEFGWIMKIGTASTDKSEDFIFPVTPPYHFNPTQYLQDAYGTPVMSYKKRNFSFLINPEDYNQAMDLIRNMPDGELTPSQKKAVKEMDIMNRGHGVFTIIDGALETAMAPWAAGGKVEKPAWLKFSVDMTIPVPDDEKCGVE